MKIVYIGPKEKKRDTISGSRMTFVRNKPAEVKDEYAETLLRFPRAYITEEGLKSHLEKVEAKEAAAKKAAEEAELKAKEEQEALSRVVMVDGQEVDLRKYTEAQLRTFVEAQDLEVEPKKSGEKVPDYCDRVHAAYVAKLAQEEAE